eukprot:TRINITY_DN2205_c0_g1_i2.p1 TRINITY_DN2205_c0_g1~~TRINITY_DN2205_c0_g1_i2.p1  ORF type:complete len:865 (+),score=96.17 TRINITY_DN2205_c0_g1_i2:129-2723(+)
MGEVTSSSSSAATSSNSFLEHASVAEFSAQLWSRLLQATTIANQLPAGPDYSFYNSFHSFRGEVSALSHRVLDLSQHLIRHELPRHSPCVNDLTDPDDIHERFHAVVDAVDIILERVDSYADQVNGTSNAPQIVVSALAPQGRGDYHLFHASNVLRPQLKFKDPPDNTNTPWIPWHLRGSHSAFKPPGASVSHPLRDKIEHLEIKKELLEPVREQKFKELSETPFTFVDTKEELERVAQILELSKEFAVDLEHHAYRSFQGFTCLMQLSTRDADFVIDALVLREHMHLLNGSFQNPDIVKVYHGSDSDIVWQQRDFGLYVVNMFDTGQAARVLELPSYALAYLLQNYCSVAADKRYQLADWRIRPLPVEMLRYAREDTHYLLYIYDRLRNELITRANMSPRLLQTVFNRSRDLCLLQYEKEIYSSQGFMGLYQRFNHAFSSVQLRVLAALYQWRDTIAREEDESIRYVLPNHMLMRIAEVAPIEPASLLACCNPVPPLVRLHADSLVIIIAAAIPEPPITSAVASAGTVPVASLTPVLPTAALSLGATNTSTNTPLRSVSPIEPSSRYEGPYAGSPSLSRDELYASAGWRSPSSPIMVSSPRSQHARAVHTSAASASSASSLFRSMGPVPSEIKTDQGNTVRMIHAAITAHSFYPTLQEASIPAPVTTLTTTVPTPVTTTGRPVSIAQVSPEEEEEEVPTTISDIYRISNRNRKKNKLKRKLKEESSRHPDAPLSPVQFSHQSPAPKRPRLDTHLSDPEFMSAIHWADPVAQSTTIALEPAVVASAITRPAPVSLSTTLPAQPPLETPKAVPAVPRSTSISRPTVPGTRGRGSFAPYSQLNQVRGSARGSRRGGGRASSIVSKT